MSQAQNHQVAGAPAPVQAPPQALPYPVASQPSLASSAYPTLGDYMGLELSEDVIRANMPEYLPGQQVKIMISLWPLRILLKCEIGFLGKF